MATNKYNFILIRHSSLLVYRSCFQFSPFVVKSRCSSSIRIDDPSVIKRNTQEESSLNKNINILSVSDVVSKMERKDQIKTDAISSESKVKSPASIQYRSSTLVKNFGSTQKPEKTPWRQSKHLQNLPKNQSNRKSIYRNTRSVVSCHSPLQLSRTRQNRAASTPLPPKDASSNDAVSDDSIDLSTSSNNNNNNSTISDEHRVNQLGIQMLTRNLYNQIFNYEKSSNVDKVTLNADSDKVSIATSIEHLVNQGLWGKKNSKCEDIDLKLPEMLGSNIDEHFKLIAEEQCKPYKKLLRELIVAKLPDVPEEFAFREGWTKYEKDGSNVSVSAPDCDVLVFDVEVCLAEGSAPTLATAASPSHWYSWCSRSLFNCDSSNKNKLSLEETFGSDMPLNDLIPLDSTQNKNKPRVIVGHNVAYDRIRIKEQYFIEDSGLRFVDTMSLHIAVGGLIQEQRALMMKNSSATRKIILPWMSVGCLNNLNDVYKHYCKKAGLSKDIRNIFVEGSLEDVKKDFQLLMNYCASDVKATHAVVTNLLPHFYDRVPHPASFSGILEMGSGYLPINDNWKKYIKSAETEYTSLQCLLNDKLKKRAIDACELVHNDKYKEDPWLWNLDWQVPRTYMRRGEVFPRWYIKLCKRNIDDNSLSLMDMSTSLRIVPKLLKLTWNGYPLHHEREHGWGYLKPTHSSYSAFLNEQTDEVECDFPIEEFYKICPNDIKEEEDNELDQDDLWEQLLYGKQVAKPKLTGALAATEGAAIDVDIPGVEFIQLPHKNGVGLNVGNPLAKDFLVKIEDGTLSSMIEDAEIVLRTTKAMAYWRNARDRILSQDAVWLPEENLPNACINSPEYSSESRVGAILPQVVVCGTVTRRAVERTWLTASNARPDRIGSELKAMVSAPPGYHFVGADVDSQELWIAALLGDSFFEGQHGCTAMSWMTLQGSKAEGTDMHSKTAQTAQITRDQAKVINYGRIYGAGLKFLRTLLRQYNPAVTVEDAHRRATAIMSSTKGEKGYRLSEEGREFVQQITGKKLTDNRKAYTRRQIYTFLNQDRSKTHSFSSLTEQPAVWTGGSESYTFNCLEDIVQRDRPQSPVLGAAIPLPLQPLYVGQQHMTSRMNWVVQSSAVDYLHLMTVSMKWLAKKYDIKMRFSISIHDEVRYLVESEDRHRAALALQITNLLCRALFAYKVGMPDLPMSVAFFSSVDIDKVLRKDPYNPCISPSNPKGLKDTYGVPEGDSLTIYDLLKQVKTLEQ